LHAMQALSIILPDSIAEKAGNLLTLRALSQSEVKQVTFSRKRML